MSEEIMIKPFFGYYEIRPSGFTIWHSNPALKMTEDEQYKVNKANHPDFKLISTLQVSK
jgi:hypothetical protein